MRIAVDVDGVLARFEHGFVRACNKLWPGRVNLDFVPKRWDFAADMGLSPAEFDRAWEQVKVTPHFWIDLPPYEDSVATMRLLLDRTPIEVYYVTSRVPTVGLSPLAQTTYWLRKHGILPGGASVIAVPHPSSKRAIYKALELDGSIDDKGETAEDCATLKNHHAYLLTRPWNLDRVYTAPRVNSVAEFGEKLWRIKDA